MFDSAAENGAASRATPAGTSGNEVSPIIDPPGKVLTSSGQHT